MMLPRSISRLGRVVERHAARQVEPERDELIAGPAHVADVAPGEAPTC